ncbi:hypothetical protein [uncultured Bacteroides sp.]|uniref:hypothetical protein n=1 Tax=uncultured Bacteroides sp. TaxID=162156 RepID=UPI0025E03BCF|nr:hypothetical protein [uncultured Bacteroides sp.]
MKTTGLGTRNMYSWLLWILVCVTPIGILTSCGDDDDDELNVSMEQLQGTWIFEKGVTKTMGQTVTIDRSQLHQIGSQMGVSFWDETLTFSGNKVNGIEYEVKGDEFHFTGTEYGDLPCTISTLTESKLVFHYDMKEMTGVDCTVDLEYEKK